MKKCFALIALLLAVACGRNEGNQSLGIGVYPGNPDENFSPALVKDDGGYRNIALLRAASHSSCADYNQTAQLVTDGLVADGPAPWTEVLCNGEPVTGPDATFLTDLNHAGLTCSGTETDLELVFHGYAPEVDRLVVAASGHRPEKTVLTVEGKAEDGTWQPLGTARPTPSKNTLIIHPDFAWT